MKRELVKSIRTVALLAMFSHDPKVVVNIQSCLKSMSVMEPDLILHPILDRAVPSLEAVVEVSLGQQCEEYCTDWVHRPNALLASSRPLALLLLLLSAATFITPARSSSSPCFSCLFQELTL